MPKGQAAPPRPYGERLAAVQAAVLAKVERGWTDAMIGAEPGLPGRVSIWRWAKADPEGFGMRLAEARRWGLGRRWEAQAPSWVFDARKAEALLARVRAGELVPEACRALVIQGRPMLASWRRQRPDFAESFAAAKREARGRRKTRWARYDPEEADRILLRVMRGETLETVLAGRGGPGVRAMRRWRREDPLFSAALRKAMGAGARVRWAAAEAAGTGRGRCTPDFMAKVEDHILRGGSLRSASLTLAGSPHYGTLYGWMKRKPHFAAMVEQAKVWRNEALLDEIAEAAMAVTPGNLRASRRRIGRLSKRYGEVNSGRPPAWMGTLE
ncbi:hypothetical protein [Phenylobacterium sp.]|uniref:terminase small subunit-like protein n=1 Tax=Phenylobacterium sp. TaxID=1871053 RepID=UPI0035AEE039